MTSVVLRCMNAKGEPSEIEISTSAGTKELKYKFTKKNGCECSVPTQLTFTDARGEVRSNVQNYAQFLLDAYSDEKQGFHFELVKEEVTPLVVEKPKKKKEKKDEEVAG